MLQKLQDISYFVLRKDARKIYEKLDGYTAIQGGRHEIYFQPTLNENGQTVPPRAAEWICGYCNVTRQQVMDYAMQRAQKDPRGNNVDFSVFSIIVNFEACFQQDNHLDSLAPSVQCAMVLTDRVKGTIVYETNYPVEKVRKSSIRA